MICLLLFTYLLAISKVNGLQLQGHYDTYQIDRFLINGTFGSLFVAESINSTNKVVIKITIHQEYQRYLIREALVNRDLRTSNSDDSRLVLSIDDNLPDPFVLRRGTIDKRKPWIIFPFYPYGDAFEFIRKNFISFTNFAVIKSIARDSLSALLELHERNFMFNDFKAENLIISQEPVTEVRVKLIDFGFAAPVDSTLRLGSPETSSPEIILSNYPFLPSIKSDIWSFGMTLYFLRYSRYIFSGKSRGDIQIRLLNYSYHELSEKIPEFYEKQPGIIRSRFNSDRIETVLGCYKSREQFHEDCLTKREDEDCFCDLLLKCVRFDPEERISTAEALNHPFLS